MLFRSRCYFHWFGWYHLHRYYHRYSIHTLLQFSPSEMNTKLEMLTAREQLMEDIDCIIDEYFQEYGITNDPELVKVLCDAVCRNFPS